MCIRTLITLAMLYLISQNSLGVNLVDLPDSSEPESNVREFISRRNINRKPPLVNTSEQIAKHWLFRQSETPKVPYEDEKDSNIKTKIATLVQQTLHDTERKIKSIQHLKESHREEAPYKIGFVLSLVKKARENLNELFNVAVKHRDSWKALEQLKIFELIVHTNVDTTNLVRQLVEIHIQYLNSTTSSMQGKHRRVVLL